MDIELFCDKLDRGEITDFGPFLHGWSERARGFNPGMNQVDDMF